MKKNDNLAEKPVYEEDRFDEYADLLTRRDQLIKECSSIQLCYTKEFGEQLIENFELKLECIKLKKSISYCRRVLNRGQSINVNSMNEAVEKEMTIYKLQLGDMKRDLKASEHTVTVDAFRLSRSKKIYRRLSKLIHPDVNSKTETNEFLRELWERVSEAYQHSNVDDLEDLEILVKKALENLGDEGFELEVEGLEDRIERIENQINEIITSEPYIYNEILESKEKIDGLHNQLSEEYKDYETYLETLKKALNELLIGNGISTTWKLD